MNSGWWFWKANVDYLRRDMLSHLERERVIRQCRGDNRPGADWWPHLMLAGSMVLIFSLSVLAGFLLAAGL